MVTSPDVDECLSGGASMGFITFCDRFATEKIPFLQKIIQVFLLL